MDRAKRSVNRVTNFHTFHDCSTFTSHTQSLQVASHTLSPQLQTSVMAQSAEELRQQLEEQKEHSLKLVEDAELMKIRNELEVEKLRHKQWEMAIEQLKVTREKVEIKIQDMAGAKQAEISKDVTGWLRSQMANLKLGGSPDMEEVVIDKEKEAKEQAIQELRMQQKELNKKLAELTGTHPPANTAPTEEKTSQDALMQQLRSALSSKKEEDPSKMLLKALITGQNKVPGEGGTNTLKPVLINSWLNPESGNTMAEWLANLNRQDEREFDLSRFHMLGEGEAKAVKKSGILDKATTNIQDKQVWPQQNLGEDWADEDVEFKQMKFEHLVAGETRTIETCTDPAQILGRLHLLRRIAYLKLRGYEWTLIRKMYAAILTSIETKEYSWESNFDRFETILYRRTSHRGRNTMTKKPQPVRGSAETSINQRDAPKTAHTRYG